MSKSKDNEIFQFIRRLLEKRVHRHEKQTHVVALLHTEH